MQIKVKFSGALSGIFGCIEKEVELEPGSNARDLLIILCKNTQRADEVCVSPGELKSHIVMVRNKHALSNSELSRVILRPGDVLEIIPLLFGG